jgi:hypothetical protein
VIEIERYIILPPAFITPYLPDLNSQIGKSSTLYWIYVAIILELEEKEEKINKKKKEKNN